MASKAQEKARLFAEADGLRFKLDALTASVDHHGNLDLIIGDEGVSVEASEALEFASGSRRRTNERASWDLLRRVGESG